MKALFSSILFLHLSLAHFAAVLVQHNTYAAIMYCLGSWIMLKPFSTFAVLSRDSCLPIQLTAMHTPNAYTSFCSRGTFFSGEKTSINDIFHHIQVYRQRQLQRQP